MHAISLSDQELDPNIIQANHRALERSSVPRLLYLTSRMAAALTACRSNFDQPANMKWWIDMMTFELNFTLTFIGRCCAMGWSPDVEVLISGVAYSLEFAGNLTLHNIWENLDPFISVHGLHGSYEHAWWETPGSANAHSLSFDDISLAMAKHEVKGRVFSTNVRNAATSGGFSSLSEVHGASSPDQMNTSPGPAKTVGDNRESPDDIGNRSLDHANSGDKKIICHSTACRGELHKLRERLSKLLSTLLGVDVLINVNMEQSVKDLRSLDLLLDLYREIQRPPTDVDVENFAIRQGIPGVDESSSKHDTNFPSFDHATTPPEFLIGSSKSAHSTGLTADNKESNSPGTLLVTDSFSKSHSLSQNLIQPTPVQTHDDPDTSLSSTGLDDGLSDDSSDGNEHDSDYAGSE